MQSSDQVQDVVNELSYFSLYDDAEKARWLMSDIPWDQIDMGAVDDRLIELARGAAYGELATYSATRAFMQLFDDDVDVTQWLAVWLYEETKHPHVLAKWLSLVGVPLSESFFLTGRKIAPMSSSKVEAVTFSFIAEMMAGINYIRTAKITPEPVLQTILQNCGKDEVRHAAGFERYLGKLIEGAEDPDAERITCLRAAWAFVHGNACIEHPVFLSDRDVATIADAELIEKTHERLNVMVARRISSVVGIEIPGPEDIYGVYRELKAKHRRRNRRS